MTALIAAGHHAAGSSGMGGYQVLAAFIGLILLRRFFGGRYSK